MDKMPPEILIQQLCLLATLLFGVLGLTQRSILFFALSGMMFFIYLTFLPLN